MTDQSYRSIYSQMGFNTKYFTMKLSLVVIKLVHGEKRVVRRIGGRFERSMEAPWITQCVTSPP
jgi:hypothetical protein